MLLKYISSCADLERMIFVQELEYQLLKDLKTLGLRTDFDLNIKGYSKTFFGRYNPNKNEITLYIYKYKNRDIAYSYKDILLTLIHECIHCEQWNDPCYVRVKGVMHNTEFKNLYNKYSNRAKALLLYREVVNNYESRTQAKMVVC